MTQLSSWDCRYVWGQSWNKQVDSKKMAMHDENAITLLTLCWDLAKTIKTLDIDGIVPKRQEETPKKQRLVFFCEFGHFHLCYWGEKHGNPLKVNIS